MKKTSPTPASAGRLLWTLLLTLCLIGCGSGASTALAAQYTALGDSLTVGSYSEPGASSQAAHGFAPTLRHLLEARASAPYTFGNHGADGATAEAVRASQLARLSPSPDIVTLTVGTSDARLAASNILMTEAAYAGQGPGTFADNLDAILSTLRSGAPEREIVLANVPDLKRLPAIRVLDTQARTRLDVFVRATNRIIATRALAYGVRVVDLYGDPKVTADENVSLASDPYGDGFHPNRRGHALLAQRFLSVLTGGSGLSWASRTASPTTASNTPGARSSSAMAFDSGRGCVVLFGGALPYLGDTWEWNGASWTQRFPTISPPARGYSAMVYDVARRRMVLFGGFGPGPAMADTWEWDGNTWTQRSPANSPSKRSGHAMAYDSGRGRTVLFGGFSGDGTNLNLGDTWEWDGTNWSLCSPPTSPPGRQAAGLAYDSARGRAVLFGGAAAGQLNDTWEWDGSTWEQRLPASSPTSRAGFGLSYDLGRGRAVLFGGVDRLSTKSNETWEWDGAAWSQRATDPSPSARHGVQAMAYDSWRGRTVLFGGELDFQSFNDTWELGAAPSEADLSVTLAAPATARRGSALRYTISVSNAGPASAQGVRVSLPLPAGTAFASLSAPPGWSATAPSVGAGGTVVATAPSLAAGISTLTVTVSVFDQASLSLPLAATATVESPSPDLDYSDLTSLAATWVHEAPSLQVTTKNDNLHSADGQTSLREAIAYAHTLSGSAASGSEPRITFAPAAFPAGAGTTISLASGEIALSRDMTIDGPGASTCSISGAGRSRIWNISGEGVAVQMSGLTLTGGRAVGAADAGSNSNAGQGRGGAILNGARLRLQSCVLEGNTAVGGNASQPYNSGGNAAGGAVYNTGVFAATDCRFANNLAQSGATTLGSPQFPIQLLNGTPYGGALYSTSYSGVATLAGCVFEGNSAGESSIFSGGGAIAGDSYLQITGSTFRGNSARTSGGAIYSSGSSTISGSAFTSNSATSFGGAVVGGLSAQVSDSRFENNTAGAAGALYGGSFLTLSRSALAGNRALVRQNVQASGSGGALWVDLYDRATISACTFRLNDAARNGGAILNMAELNLRECTLSANSAGGSGGALHSAGPYAQSKATVSSCTIAGNSAPAGSGLASGDGGLALGSSLVALNGAGPDVSGATQSLGYNLIGTLGSATGLENGVGGNQVLGAVPAASFGLDMEAEGQPRLADNGGPTLTIRLLAGSPALDRGRSASLADQRGLSRSVGGPDVGAYEAQKPLLDLDTSSPGSDSSVAFREGQRPLDLTPQPASLASALPLSSAQIQLLPRPGDSTERLAADTAGTALSATWADGALTIGGSGSVEEYRQVLASVSYANSSADPGSASRTAFFTVSNSEGQVQASATITVQASNDAPRLLLSGAWQGEGSVLEEDTPLVIGGPGSTRSLQVADADAGSAPLLLSLSIGRGALTLGSTQGLSFEAGTADGRREIQVRGRLGALNAALSGLEVQPPADFHGPLTLTLSVSDLGSSGAGGPLQAEAAPVLVFAPVNDAPTFVLRADASVEVEEDAGHQVLEGFAAEISPGPADEGGQGVGFRVVGNTAPALFSVSPSLSPGGTLRYTPAPDASGRADITVALSDDGPDAAPNHNTSAPQTFTITVTARNDAPVAVNDAASTDEDTPVLVDVRANDTDIDSPTLTITALAPGAGTHGTLAIEAGKVRYTPEANYNGPSTWGYTLSDGALSASARATVTVRPINDAPRAQAQDVATREDTSKAITLGATDVDSAALSFRIVTPPAHGTLSGAAPNVLYTPADNANGSDSFAFVASDGALDSNVATVSITVGGVEDAPVAVSQKLQALEDTLLAITLGATDVDSAALSFRIVTPPAHGTLSGAAPNVLYTPAANANGADSFAFVASDGTFSSNVATVELQVLAVNDAPVAVADAFDLPGWAPLAMAAPGVLGNDADADGDRLSAALATSPTHGTLLFREDGSFTYTPHAGFNGADSFAYRASDGAASSEATTVSLDVSGNPGRSVSLLLSAGAVSEGGSITATLRLSRPADTNLTVLLGSTVPSAATVPASVQVLAGQTSASFKVTAPRNPLATGGRALTISADAGPFGKDFAFLLVPDSEVPTLTLAVTPTQVGENFGPAAAVGTLTRNTPTASALVARLSTNSSAVRVPAAVAIPAGAKSATFLLDVLDNRVSNAARKVDIVARAAKFKSAAATVIVSDNGRVARDLRLALEDSGRYTERVGGQVAQGSVTLPGAPLSRPLVITLASADRTRLLLPSAVVLPAGQSTVRFAFRVLDNNVAEGSFSRVWVAARAAGYGTSALLATIQDNDGPALVLSLPRASASEAAGSLVATVARRNAPASAGSPALLVALSSSNSRRVTVPATVTIPQGRASATFVVRLVNNSVADGTARVTLAASKGGLTTGTATLDVLDDDGRPAAAAVAAVGTPLSQATASVRAGVRLRFWVGLAEEPARDALRYQVAINGEVVKPEALSYDGAQRTVTILFPGGSLQQGDKVEVGWQGLLDLQGRRLSGSAQAVATP